MNFNFNISFSSPLRVVIETGAPAVLVQINQKLDTIMTDLTQLTAEVAQNKDVIDSAVVLLKGLKTKLDEAGTDPTKLAELSASLDSQSNALAAAVAENTPSA